MNDLRSNSADLPLVKSIRNKLVTSQVLTSLVAVSDCFIKEKSTNGNCSFQNSSNNATEICSENIDFSDDDIIIEYENTNKVEYIDAHISTFRNKNSPNDVKIGTKILDKVVAKNKCCNPPLHKIKKKDISENHNIMIDQFVLQNECSNLRDSKSNDKDVLDIDIKTLDAVTSLNKCYNRQREAKRKGIVEDDDIIIDKVIVYNVSDSDTKDKGISKNNTKILEERTFEKECIDVSGNDTPSFDKFTTLCDNHNSPDSKSKHTGIPENTIKIVDVFSITTNEFNWSPEARVKFKSGGDEIMLDIDINENKYNSQELVFEKSSNYNINIKSKYENEISCSGLPNTNKIKSFVKNITTGRKNFTDKVTYSSKNQEGEFGQDLQKAVSYKKVDYSSEDEISATDEANSCSSYKGRNISSKISCSLFEQKKNKDKQTFVNHQISSTEESNSCSSYKDGSVSNELNDSLPEREKGSNKNQASGDKANAMLEHPNSNYDYCYKCIWCSFITSTTEGIKQHMKEKHSQLEKMKCPFCYFKPVHREYFNHVNSHLGNPPHSCWMCPYFTASVKYFISHIKCHEPTSPKKFNCEKCSFSSDILLEISEHKSVHLNTEEIQRVGKIFQCKSCSRIFKRKGNLTRHQNAHKDKLKTTSKHAEPNSKLFKCRNCTFSAVREMTFLRHRSVHHPENVKE